VDAADQLLTLAEISVALAGFAGIIASFQIKRDSDVTRGRVISLAIIVYISLGGAFFATFPLLLMNFGLSDAGVWKWSSLLIGTNQLIVAAFVWKNAPIARWEPLSKFIFISAFFLSGFLAICNLLNAASIIFERNFAVFFAIYMFNLGIVCLNFARLMMTPLWRILSVREESERVVSE
jgi:hypothetical protein